MATFSKKIKDWKRAEDKVLTQRVLSTLTANGGSMVLDEEHTETLVEIVTDGSNSVRHGRFGASSRGDCRRQQVFKYLGIPTVPHGDPTLSNIFLDGTWRHVRWQMMGLQYGWFTRVEVKEALPELRLGVSADAVNDDEGWGFELKGTSRLVEVIKNGVPLKHQLQIHTMMLAFDFDKWVYMAEDKSRQEIHEVVVERDEELIKSVTEELLDLNEHINNRTLPPVLPACGGASGPLWKSCAFRDVCLGFDAASIPAGEWDHPV